VGCDRPVSHAAALVDEIANELDTWPGVHIERLSEQSALVRYQELELGFLDRDRGIAELRLANLEPTSSSSMGMLRQPIRSPKPRW
jgi:hypothetical protein